MLPHPPLRCCQALTAAAFSYWKACYTVPTFGDTLGHWRKSHVFEWENPGLCCHPTSFATWSCCLCQQSHHQQTSAMLDDVIFFVSWALPIILVQVMLFSSIQRTVSRTVLLDAFLLNLIGLFVFDCNQVSSVVFLASAFLSFNQVTDCWFDHF